MSTVLLLTVALIALGLVLLLQRSSPVSPRPKPEAKKISPGQILFDKVKASRLKEPKFAKVAFFAPSWTPPAEIEGKDSCLFVCTLHDDFADEDYQKVKREVSEKYPQIPFDRLVVSDSESTTKALRLSFKNLEQLVLA